MVSWYRRVPRRVPDRARVRVGVLCALHSYYTVLCYSSSLFQWLPQGDY